MKLNMLKERKKQIKKKKIMKINMVKLKKKLRKSKKKNIRKLAKKKLNEIFSIKIFVFDNFQNIHKLKTIKYIFKIYII